MTGAQAEQASPRCGAFQAGAPRRPFGFTFPGIVGLLPTAGVVVSAGFYATMVPVGCGGLFNAQWTASLTSSFVNPFSDEVRVNAVFDGIDTAGRHDLWSPDGHPAEPIIVRSLDAQKPTFVRRSGTWHVRRPVRVNWGITYLRDDLPPIQVSYLITCPVGSYSTQPQIVPVGSFPNVPACRASATW